MNTNTTMINTENYREDIHTIRDTEAELSLKFTQLKQVLERLCKEATKREAMQFSTLFSRLVFIAQKYNLPKRTEWELQNFRVKVTEQRKNNQSVDQKTYNQSERAILDLCSLLSSEESVSNSASNQDISVVEEAFEKDTSNYKQTKPALEDTLRVQILSIDKDNYLLQCAIANSPGNQITVRYNVSPDNSIFTPSVSLFKENSQLNLVDYTTDADGYIMPKIIVLEPDYLIDASAIAMCFNNFGISHLNYLVNKFELMENRSYLLLGNLANYFLDELIFADNPEELSFDKVFLQSFKQSPFEYATCEDIMSDYDFRKFMDKAKEQFHNIKRVITKDFPQQNINPKRSTLEPSFFSEKFGFQGRLDLLQTGDDNNHFKIIELKSGRLPFPYNEKGKVALGHEVQTAIYRLMIESVYNQTSRNIDVAILYSAGNYSGENLRFAAIYQNLEKEILNLRNLIVHNEYSISQGNIEDVEAQFKSLNTLINLSDRVPDFFVQKIKKIEDTLLQCSQLERMYFYRFVQFI